MRKHILLLFLLPILGGCFKDETKTPTYWSKQEIKIPQDTVICRTGYESFSSYIITYTNPESFDSVQWFLVNPNGYEYFATGQQIEIPVSYSGNQIRYVHYFGDSYLHGTIYIFACTANMYIPVAFTPNGDGINDKWAPVYTASVDSYSVHWEIRTLDGIKVFEANEFNPGWDGRYNELRMPPGGYLYYIELQIEGEAPVEYTGWLELLG